MAPTCDWMIKIVKVNHLYLNSLLVSMVNRVSREIVSLGGRPETGAFRVFHRRQEWLQLMRRLIFFSFWLNNLYTEIKTERAIY